MTEIIQLFEVVPDISIFTEDHQCVVEKVEDRSDDQEDEPEPEEDKNLLNDDVEGEEAHVVLDLLLQSRAVRHPDAGGQSGDRTQHFNTINWARTYLGNISFRNWPLSVLRRKSDPRLANRPFMNLEKASKIEKVTAEGKFWESISKL